MLGQHHLVYFTLPISKGCLPVSWDPVRRKVELGVLVLVHFLHPCAQGGAWTFSEELLCIYTNTNGVLGWDRIAAVSLHLNLMGSVRYQPSQVWEMLVLLPAEAVKHRQQFIQFTEGFAFSDRHLLCNSIFNCSNPYHDFIICSPGK